MEAAVMDRTAGRHSQLVAVDSPGARQTVRADAAMASVILLLGLIKDQGFAARVAEFPLERRP